MEQWSFGGGGAPLLADEVGGHRSIASLLGGRGIRYLASGSHTNGNTFAAIITAAIPAKPINVSSVEKVFRVSLSVRPLILPTTQKPLSFIHGIGFEPQPIASAR